MRRYRNVLDGRIAVCVKLPFSGGEYYGEHVYVEVFDSENKIDQKNPSWWWRCADFKHVVEVLEHQLGGCWCRVRYK